MLIPKCWYVDMSVSGGIFFIHDRHLRLANYDWTNCVGGNSVLAVLCCLAGMNSVTSLNYGVYACSCTLNISTFISLSLTLLYLFIDPHPRFPIYRAPLHAMLRLYLCVTTWRHSPPVCQSSSDLTWHRSFPLWEQKDEFSSCCGSESALCLEASCWVSSVKSQWQMCHQTNTFLT